MTRKLGIVNKGLDHFLIQNGSFHPSSKVPKTKIIPPGIYTINSTMSGSIYFSPMSVVTDGLVDLPMHVSSTIINEVVGFWKPEIRAKYNKFGTIYKKGILLFGPPGSGKSIIVSKIMEKVVNDGGIVFFDPSPALLFKGMQQIKEIMGDIKVLVIYEEIDAWLSQAESQFLSLLSGEMELENIVYIATTNYLDRIPLRFRNRPSRFSNVVEVGNPDASTRKAFLLGKVQDEPIDVDLWVSMTEGMSLDHLKDLIVSVLCIGIPLDNAIQKLRDMNTADLRTDKDVDEMFDSDDSGNVVKTMPGQEPKRKRYPQGNF